MEHDRRPADHNDEETVETRSSASTRTTPSPETRQAERADAQTPAGADAPVTERESRMAPAKVTDAQRAHAEEMLERGSHQQGEGRIP